VCGTVIALRRGADDRRDQVVDVNESVERSALALDLHAERVPVELHVGEVLEQDVVRLVAATLELLAGAGCPMGSGELVNRDFSHPAMTTDPWSGQAAPRIASRWSRFLRPANRIGTPLDSTVPRGDDHAAMMDSPVVDIAWRPIARR